MVSDVRAGLHPNPYVIWWGFMLRRLIHGYMRGTNLVAFVKKKKKSLKNIFLIEDLNLG